MLAASVPARARAAECDELVSRLLAKAIAPAIEHASCGPLGQAGLDVPAHHIDSVCYTSTGRQSTVKVTAALSCRTGDHAFVHVSKTETVTLEAEIRGSDCRVIRVDATAADGLGKVLLRAFDAEGRAREELRRALAGAC